MEQDKSEKEKKGRAYVKVVILVMFALALLGMWLFSQLWKTAGLDASFAEILSPSNIGLTVLVLLLASMFAFRKWKD